jgi:hypothetical protein
VGHLLSTNQSQNLQLLSGKCNKDVERCTSICTLSEHTNYNIMYTAIDK